MKPKMNRKELKDNNDIWNAVTKVLSEQDFPTESQEVNDAFLAFQYYSEMESGGHEALLNWSQDYIREVGIQKYQDELASSLVKIGAPDFAEIESTHLAELWKLHLALENDESHEDDYYSKIELMDNAYHEQNGKLEHLLEIHFHKIHTDLIDVVED
ncbi:hypothetical protein [Metaplanococcus flavidus]|uniref:DUF4375 domain-containing protein n=1 Tax=Metaplanococcus flavidus TaxID=569883 RepID=A0ABW3L8G1_9BACL